LEQKKNWGGKRLRHALGLTEKRDPLQNETTIINRRGRTQKKIKKLNSEKRRRKHNNCGSRFFAKGREETGNPFQTKKKKGRPWVNSMKKKNKALGWKPGKNEGKEHVEGEQKPAVGGNTSQKSKSPG